jgi:hypothetical protein
MKRLVVTLVMALLMVAATIATDLTGSWEIEASFDDNTEVGGFDCAFTQTANRISGKCSGGTASLTGAVDGKIVTWRVSSASNPPVTTVFTGTLNATDTRIDGRFTVGDKGGQFIAAKS